MIKTTLVGLLGGSILLSVCIAGCGSDGPTLVKVKGTITKGGQPVANAQVEFQPKEEGGSPSSGTTDDKGNYSLQFTADESGAMPGEHIVLITLPGGGQPGVDDEDGSEGDAIERTATVKKGGGPYDFDL